MNMIRLEDGPIPGASVHQNIVAVQQQHYRHVSGPRDQAAVAAPERARGQPTASGRGGAGAELNHRIAKKSTKSRPTTGAMKQISTMKKFELKNELSRLGEDWRGTLDVLKERLQTHYGGDFYTEKPPPRITEHKRISKMTVNELKSELRSRHLDDSGNKPALVQRLCDANDGQAYIELGAHDGEGGSDEEG